MGTICNKFNTIMEEIEDVYISPDDLIIGLIELEPVLINFDLENEK